LLYHVRYMTAGNTTKLIRILILLIAFQCISTAFFSVVGASNDDHQTALHSKHQKSFAMIFEKAAEEERAEEEGDKFLAIELADFSKLAILRSLGYTPHINSMPYEQRIAPQHQLFKLHCVYVI
jgi:hypothetical protein